LPVRRRGCPGCGRAVSIPYEAAAWSVLAQRLRIVQAARLRAELIARHGESGAFAPARSPATEPPGPPDTLSGHALNH
jgi:3-methyladenine DNA glycosylase/8-oxoguanine DNA glycosylase